LAGRATDMTLSTKFVKSLGCELPIIQAPMAGGGDTPALVAGVCEAGGMGFVGAAYLDPAQIADVCRAVRGRTRRPFGINLFVTEPVHAVADTERAFARVAPYFAELGLEPPTLPASVHPEFAPQLAAVLDSGASAFSFTFGALPATEIAAIRARGIRVLGTATTVAEALALEATEVDAIIAQGAEAGGHRGSFDAASETGLIGTMALVPQIVDAVALPVIASGGIMDGRGIAAALALGASAVQLGTVFLLCEESGAAQVYKDAILRMHDDDTRITRAFSGRRARGIVNRFMRDIDAAGGADILPFPQQNALTRRLRAAAAKAGRAEFLSLWAGQGGPMARAQPVAQLMRSLVAETEQAISRLRGPAQ
jgi:nitronate monooxygenase